MPFSRSAGLSETCWDGNLPSFLIITLAHSDTMAIAIINMHSRKLSAIFPKFACKDSAIGSKYKTNDAFFAPCAIPSNISRKDMDTKDLAPRSVFGHFASISGIPRPSGHEERMIGYLVEFGRSRGLETRVDAAGNVIIRKAAHPGYGDRGTVILQSHMDMVCERLPGVDIDFLADGITTRVDGDWLRAEGTTLGADDGIGCAMQLAVLDDPGIEHGPLECVFTTDEETGLTGASGMEPGFMTGSTPINLDSEEEGQFFISCAGGVTTTAEFGFHREEAPGDHFFMELGLEGLHGGHSGDDIDKKFANAIKLLARFMYLIDGRYGARIASFDSGRMHNAIPRDGRVVFSVPAGCKENVSADLNAFRAGVQEEFRVTEGGLCLTLASHGRTPVLPVAVGRNLVLALQAVANGPLAMCQDEALGWMVETSSNVASVGTAQDSVRVVTSQRSNVASNLENMGNTVKALFELAGASVGQDGAYPAWKVNPDSELTSIVAGTYRKLFGKEPRVVGIHAGLECGLFSEKYPGLDMVSMGPTMRGVHSPDERLFIPSVQRVWDHLLEILKNIP